MEGPQQSYFKGDLKTGAGTKLQNRDGAVLINNGNSTSLVNADGVLLTNTGRSTEVFNQNRTRIFNDASLTNESGTTLFNQLVALLSSIGTLKVTSGCLPVNGGLKTELDNYENAILAVDGSGTELINQDGATEAVSFLTEGGQVGNWSKPARRGSRFRQPLTSVSGRSSPDENSVCQRPSLSS